MKAFEWAAVFIVAVVSCGLAFWQSAAHAPVHPWPALVSGFAYSPLRHDQRPDRGEQPSLDEIRADLQLLAQRTRAVRIYSLSGNLAFVPALAAELGLRVTVGMAIGADATANRQALARLQASIGGHANIDRVIIGNEAVLEERIEIGALQQLLDDARRTLNVPVSTAEPWHVWLQNPSLARHVDFIAVHLLPYWEGVAADRAVEAVEQRLRSLRAAFADKHIVIGEVGWPAAGRTRLGGPGSAQDQAQFLSAFVTHARLRTEDYFVLEAFDQPWKWRREGEVGAHWGVFDAHRVAKLDFQSGRPLTAQPGVAGLWFTAVFCLLLFALRRDGAALRFGGRVLLVAVAFASTALMFWVVSQSLMTYWNLPSQLFFTVLMAATAIALLLLLCEAHEWAEAHWIARARQAGSRCRSQPMVSVHVPVCNEPPAMVAATLNALASLDYPHYEVIVVDNNTTDPTLWRPVQRLCADLGSRFRFIHRDVLAGFKAGALNLALQRTASTAQLVAVVDADYQVSPRWLRDLVGLFDDPGTDIVQAPQDYRDAGVNAFKRFCAAEYRGFFCIGMVVRDRRNAIIQHGTMTIVRRRALDAAGGWGEWCITEDAELGLRVLAAAGRARYVPESYGQGLTPDNFLDYKRQRFRWALGAVHILRRYCRAMLFGKPGALGRAQRYHFAAGWLPWLADGAGVLFTVAAVLGTALMNQWPHRFAVPVLGLCAIPLVLCAFRMCKHVHLYRRCVRADWGSTFGAALAGLALMPTAGLASVCGVLGIRRDFLRTPKFALRHRRLAALASVRAELAMLLALGAAALVGLPQSPFLAAEALMWRLMLAVMALPYASAVVLAMIASMPVPDPAALKTRALQASASGES